MTMFRTCFAITWFYVRYVVCKCIIICMIYFSYMKKYLISKRSQLTHLFTIYIIAPCGISFPTSGIWFDASKHHSEIYGHLACLTTCCLVLYFSWLPLHSNGYKWPCFLYDISLAVMSFLLQWPRRQAAAQHAIPIYFMPDTSFALSESLGWQS